MRARNIETVWLSKLLGELHGITHKIRRNSQELFVFETHYCLTKDFASLLILYFMINEAIWSEYQSSYL